MAVSHTGASTAGCSDAEMSAEGRRAALETQQQQQQATLAALADSTRREPTASSALGDTSYRKDGGVLAGAALQTQQVGLDGLADAMQRQQEILAQALGALAANSAAAGSAVDMQRTVLLNGVFSELDQLRVGLEEVRAESRAAAASSVDRQVVLSLVKELHAFKESTNQELAELRAENDDLRSQLGTADERASKLEQHNEALLAKAIGEATAAVNRDLAEMSRRISEVDGQERQMEQRLVGLMADAKSGREILGGELQTLRSECERLRDGQARAEERVGSTQRDASKLQFEVDAFKKSIVQSELPRLSTAIEHKAEADIVDVLEVQMKDCRTTIADLATKIAGLSGRERPAPQPKASPRDLEAEIQRRSQAILSDFGSRGWDSFSPRSRERSASQPPLRTAAGADGAAATGLKHAAAVARSKVATRAEEGIPEVDEEKDDASESTQGGTKELFGGGTPPEDGDDMYAGVRAGGD
eukprot:COSAG02_NODE_5805_length_4024_cov_3.059873_3_plen_475_part_00